MPRRRYSTALGHDLFERSKKRRSSRKYRTLEIPTSTILNNENLDTLIFNINESGKNAFIDLNKTELQLVIQILEKDGKPLKNIGSTNYANKQVSFIQNGMHSLFQNLSVSVNNQVVTQGNNDYAHNSYLIDFFDTSAEAKRGYLSSQLWYPDSTGEMNNVDGSNTGYIERAKNFGNVPHTVIGNIHSPLFEQEKPMPPGTNIRLEFKLNKPGFYFMSNRKKKDNATPLNPNAFKLKIIDAKVFAHYIDVEDEVIQEEESKLKRESMSYQVKDVVTKAFTVKPSSQKINIRDVSTGKLPESVVVGFTTDTSYTGMSLVESPYNFKAYDLDTITLNVDNKPYADLTLTPNTDNPDFARTYRNFFDQTGLTKDGGVNAPEISKFDFLNGYCLYPWRLEPDTGDGSVYEGEGALSIDLEFTKIPEKALRMIVLAVYNREIFINKDKNPTDK